MRRDAALWASEKYGDAEAHGAPLLWTVTSVPTATLAAALSNSMLWGLVACCAFHGLMLGGGALTGTAAPIVALLLPLLCIVFWAIAQRLLQRVARKQESEDGGIGERGGGGSHLQMPLLDDSEAAP